MNLKVNSIRSLSTKYVISPDERNWWHVGFWGVATFIMAIGLWNIDDIPIKLIKIVVIAQLAIITMERVIKELKSEREE